MFRPWTKSFIQLFIWLRCTQERRLSSFYSTRKRTLSCKEEWVYNCYNFFRINLSWPCRNETRLYFVLQPKNQSSVHLVCSRPTSHALQILKALLHVTHKTIRLTKDVVSKLSTENLSKWLKLYPGRRYFGYAIWVLSNKELKNIDTYLLMVVAI